MTRAEDDAYPEEATRSWLERWRDFMDRNVLFNSGRFWWGLILVCVLIGVAVYAVPMLHNWTSEKTEPPLTSESIMADEPQVQSSDLDNFLASIREPVPSEVEDAARALVEARAATRTAMMEEARLKNNLADVMLRQSSQNMYEVERLLVESRALLTIRDANELYRDTVRKFVMRSKALGRSVSPWTALVLGAK